VLATVNVASNLGRSAVNIRALASSLFRKTFAKPFATPHDTAPPISPGPADHLAAPSYRPQDPWEKLLARLDDLIGFLDSVGESDPARELLVYRAPVTTKDTKGVTELLLALDEGEPLSGLVVQRLDHRGLTGREFSAANKRFCDVKQGAVEAAQAVLAVSNPPVP